MKAVEVLRVAELFEGLGWPVVDTPYDQFPRLFERFCRMLNRLDPLQRELMLVLTRSYAWIRPEETRKCFLRAWHKMALALTPEVAEIAVVPLPKDLHRPPKSSDSVHYELKIYGANLQESLGERRLVFTTLPRILRRKQLTATALVLVDDYIGSGVSIQYALEHLRRAQPRAQPNRVFAVAAAAQAQAIDVLATHHCTVVADHMLERGISDNPNIADTTAALNLMADMSDQFGLPRELRLGYRNTEALATLLRTPDNTFPVYWTDRKVRGVVWDSPFPRFSFR